jgi:hypothetical protein
VSRRALALAALLLAACAEVDGGGAAIDAGPADAAPVADGAPPAPAPDTGWIDDAFQPSPPPPDAASLEADAAPMAPDAASPPPPVAQCVYRAVDFDGPQREYDVMGRSDERLRFTIEGLPDPAAVRRAVLTFDTWDADHPGAEGRIWLNGQGPWDIPARADGDNQPGTGEVDVTGATVAGGNRVEFGSSLTEARTFYRIGRVALRLDVQGAACPEGPPPPPPDAVVRSLHYRRAEYTQRRNWVVRCDDYAYTGRGDEHLEEDCDGLYRPDGSRRGTAIFRFPAVVEAEYEVRIRSRHTPNRNPRGALFVVNGVEGRVAQNDDRDRVEDVWGRVRLGGDVTVVLDSSRDDGSDSVIEVRLVPVR